MNDALGVAICGVLLVVCLAIGRFVQWLTEVEDARPGPPTMPRVYGDDGPCERCGGRIAVQYGVSVWFAATRRDGETTYDSVHRWCSHCREQVEAEIDSVVNDEARV